MALPSGRIGTDNNLGQGATADILIIKFPDGFPEGQLIFNFDMTPRSITGIQKVAQMFLKILFTSVGSDVIYPNRGTRFSELTVNSNVIDSDAVFMSELKDQIRSAESQVKYLMNSGTDTFSQLKEISIIGLDALKDSATIYLRLLTMAGEMAKVSVPFPQTDLSMSPNV